jgi:hypothetical protein
MKNAKLIIPVIILSLMITGCTSKEEKTQINMNNCELPAQEPAVSTIDTAIADSFVGHYEDIDKSIVNIEKKGDSYIIDILLYQTATIGGTLLRTEDDRLIFDCKSDDGEAAIVAFMVENDKYYLGFDESELAYVEPGLWSEFLPVKNH